MLPWSPFSSELPNMLSSLDKVTELKFLELLPPLVLLLIFMLSLYISFGEFLASFDCKEKNGEILKEIIYGIVSFFRSSYFNIETQKHRIR